MEGGPSSESDCRLGAANTRLNKTHVLHGCTGAGALAPLALASFICGSQQLRRWRELPLPKGGCPLRRPEIAQPKNPNMCNSYTDGGRFLFEMGPSPETPLRFTTRTVCLGDGCSDGRRFIFRSGPSLGTYVNCLYDHTSSRSSYMRGRMASFFKMGV